MKLLRDSFVLWLCLCFAPTAWADGYAFQVRYQAGALATTRSGDDWGDKLTVTAQVIVLELQDGQSLRLYPRDITAVRYGQDARRLAGKMGTLANATAPAGPPRKAEAHFVGLEYALASGEKGGLLVAAHPDSFRQLLAALQGVTGKSLVADVPGVAERPKEPGIRADAPLERQAPPPTRPRTVEPVPAKRCYENGHKVPCPPPPEPGKN